MKRFVSLSILLFLAVTSFAYDVEVNGIYYNLSGTEATVTYYSISSASSNVNAYTGSVDIPQNISYRGTTYSVISIDSYAFYACHGVTNITIPECITSIGYLAFYGTAWYNNQPDGLVYAGKCLYCYKGTMPLNTAIEIQEGTMSICSTAFKECTGLTSVTIPSSVVSIGSGAFKGCTGLTSVIIPKGLSTIGDSAFSGCSNLTGITISEGVTSIGSYAFESCYRLTGITIPSSVTSIRSYAFDGCRGFEKVIIPDISKWCEISFGNQYSNPLYYAKHLYGDESTEITNLVIPEDVTSINSYAFYNCSGLTNVTINEGVTSIGSDAFANCSEMTSINIPSTVTSIDNYAFYNCYALKNVIVPSSVTSIGKCAFEFCTGLTDLTISEGVTSIGSNAFFGCTSLQSVTLPSTLTSVSNGTFQSCTGIKSVTIPSSLTSIGDGGFADCTGLEKVIVPDIIKWCTISIDGVTSSPLYYAGHLYSDEDTEITELTIPDGVTNIYSYAFYGCTGFTSVAIPSSVTYIYPWTFYKCSSLTSIYSYIEDPDGSLSNSGFSDEIYSDVTLFVPAGTKSKYQSAYWWKNFKNIVERDETSVDKIGGKETGTTTTSSYSLDGKAASRLQNGVIVLKMSDGTTRKVLMK